MLTIVNGVTSKQVLANEIINLLETMGLDGYFYLGYPVLGGIDGKIKVDALLVSEQTGIVLFDLETLAEENMEDKIQLLDELYNNMEAKLKRYGYLSKKTSFTSAELMYCLMHPFIKRRVMKFVHQ